jgi:hypothetical protein
MEEITAEELKKRIREILDYGRVIYPKDHLKKRMGERSYDIVDIKHILKNGEISDIARTGNEKYRCKVSGKDIEDCNGAVIAEVDRNIKLIIVTVLGGV